MSRFAKEGKQGKRQTLRIEVGYGLLSAQDECLINSHLHQKVLQRNLYSRYVLVK